MAKYPNLERRGDVYHFRSVIGGKLYRRTTGFSDAQRAKRRAREIENEIRSGKLGWLKADVPTFKAYQVTFLAAHYPGKYTEAHLLKAAVEKWGARSLNAITTSDAQQLFRDMEADQFAGATKERTRVVLKRLFRAAISDKLIDTNPLDSISVFKSAARNRVVSPEQETLLRSVLKPVWDRYLTVAIGTGLRAGELRAVRPMDLRHNGTWLWVPPESNKTRTGREVPLTPAVIAALETQQASRKGDETVPYWTYGASAAAHALERACEAVNIDPAFSPHDLRRSFATRCALSGMAMKHLQLILGHSDINVTAKHYLHLEKKSTRAALLETI